MTRGHRSIIVAIAAALVLVAGGGGLLVYRAYSQESNVVTVNGQGIPIGLYDQAQTEQAGLQQRYPGYFTRFGDINRLITDMLIQQEATRRGIACTTQDGVHAVATQIALAPRAADGLSALLRNADLFGVVPPGYVKTPEGQRTPSTADAVATWAVNPTILKGYTDMCTVARVYDAVTPPGATNDQRNGAIDALLAGLRASAHITPGGSVRVDTPTPYATPTPATPAPAASATAAAAATATP